MHWGLIVGYGNQSTIRILALKELGRELNVSAEDIEQWITYGVFEDDRCFSKLKEDFYEKMIGYLGENAIAIDSMCIIEIPVDVVKEVAVDEKDRVFDFRSRGVILCNMCTEEHDDRLE